MKSVIVSLIFGFGLIAGNLANAQDTSDLTVTNIDWSSASDWQVALQAIEQVPPMPAIDVTNGNTFYSARHAPGTSEPWPPLPGNVLDFQAWDLGDGNYLLDDLDYNYHHRHGVQNQSTSDLNSGMTMAADDDPVLPADGDGSTNDYSADELVGLSPNYGTNLYIAEVSQSAGYYSGIISNTVSGTEYELQYMDDLESTNGWQSANPNWFVYGSDTTNWTTFSVPMLSSSNMFFRVRSWGSVDDGSDLPLWWEQEYFGTNLVDANAQDSAGDGWTIYQKYEMGVPPATFTTPPAPQNVTSSYNPNTGLVSVNWQAAPGPVISYTVNIDGTDYSVSAGSTSFQNNISEDDAYYNTSFLGPTYYGQVQVQANYAGGDSPNTTVPLEAMTDDFQDTPGYIISGQGGHAYLTVPALPSGIVSLEITRIDNYAEDYWGDDSFDTNFNISVSSLSNGIVALPAPWSGVCPVDGYGASDYEWWIQTVDAQGNVSSALPAGYGYADYGNLFYNDYSGPSSEWPAEPWFDGRKQLKENLIFLLRAGLNGRQFSFTGLYTNGAGQVVYSYPTNYAYASFYEFGNDGVSAVNYVGVFLPFGENYLYDNFVFNLSALNGSGALPSFNNLAPYYYNLGLEEPPANVFDPPTVSGTAIAPVLSTNGWIYSSLPYYTYYGFNPDSNPTIGMAVLGTTNVMLSGYQNTFGLSFLSTELAWGNSGSDTATLYPGDWTTQSGILYAGAAEPELETVGYNFWNTSDYDNTNMLPGMSGFSTTASSQLLIAGVGQQDFRVAAYAKEALLNGYSSVYGYLGQYFTNAYQINGSGNVTTNQTGILSPYGDFFPTYPGPVALVTMPDPDTGQQGTTTVYCVSLALDANHDGNMDLNFGGTDATSPIKPYVFWCNNNYDRYVLDSDDGVFYDDDVAANSSDAACPYTPNTPTPDCNFLDGAGHRVIPNIRDLQDYTRLWVCGVTSNLLAALPTGSTITLNWGDVGSPNPANPTIDIFQAADTNGGLGYLTNVITSDVQIDSASYPRIGRIGPGSNLVLNASAFANNWAGNYFIWCGVSNGTGGLNLTIANSSGTVLAQTTAYIKIVDIKQMYERWIVGDNPGFWPTNEASLASEDLPLGVPAFQYTPSTDTNTPYIFLVHGWNDDRWEKDRFAESAFKRLYWQGYQGRFGEFRWPTTYGFTGSFWQAVTDPRNYDNGEHQAWLSGEGLMNKLNDLNTEYPNHVYVLAHSMGNVVASEALRLASVGGYGQLVNTYVASQAALPAHNYDATVTTPYLLPFTFTYPTLPLSLLGSQNYGPDTPDIYVNRLTNNAAAVGRRISFYNENDFALAMPRWGFDQITKPDYIPPNSYYYYGGSLSDSAPWNHFFISPIVGDDGVLTDIVTNVDNLYAVMSYAAESRSTALGATPGVANLTANFDLTTIWPSDADDYTAHFWHSAEFRGDCWQEWGYWNTLLFSPSSGFNISGP